MLASAANPEHKHFSPSSATRLEGPTNPLKTFEEILWGEKLHKLDPHQHLFHQGDDDKKIYKIEIGPRTALSRPVRRPSADHFLALRRRHPGPRIRLGEVLQRRSRHASELPQPA
ncbi:hypothetical protein G5V57_15065 [Nordella sp. HKS 07]|uniref:hypothetical protein n=1 Tax=Nordella sp. HKS 07 TaxID=2712222 RepID=UPI0013E12D60|nr:hypothetical protein [Nordella sp. HKS 07]QIG48930.1 hypothetical protein G5V57_15065 [Nordella sp. HKS 07]